MNFRPTSSSVLPQDLFPKLMLAGMAIASFALAPIPALAQRITSPSPFQGATDVEPGTPISASFEPEDGVTVVPSSVQVFVDGIDVTPLSVVTQNFFTYRPNEDLTPGEHRVRLVFENSQGLRQRARWRFTVGTPIIAEIEQVDHNGLVEVGDTLLVTVTGTPGSQVAVFLVQDGESLSSFGTEEIAEGLYIASTEVTAEDIAAESIVVARLQRGDDIRFATAQDPLVVVANANVEEVELEADEEESGGEEETASSPPLEPRMTNYEDGDRVSGASFTVRGRTAPNASVRVVVVAENSIGGFISAQRGILDSTVQANEQGRFRVEVQPGIVSAGSRYSIRMVATDGDRQSETVSYELIQE